MKREIPSVHPHSALVLRGTAVNTGSRCCEPGCGRVGRYTIQIAGYHIQSKGLLGGNAVICRPCAEAERARWDELCGRPIPEEVLADAA